MKTVLQEGDFVLVNKIHGPSNPGRGRVVVFKNPPGQDSEEPPLLFFGRCAGMPGDTILVTPDGFFVNGRAIQVESGKAFRILKNVKPALLETLRRLDIPLRSVAEDSLSMTIRLTAHEESLLRNHLHQALQIESAPEAQGGYRFVIPFEGYDYLPDSLSLFLYARAIRQETDGRVQSDGAKLFADGREVTAYRFARDYYWMSSDGGEAVDSRHLGFVPRTCVAGNVWLCWYSRNKSHIFRRIY
jgi:signal peptidase I